VAGRFATAIGIDCQNSIVPNLQLKLGFQCIPEDSMERLTAVARFVSETANITPDDKAPYAGSHERLARPKPRRPSKLRLEVEAQRSPGFRRSAFMTSICSTTDVPTPCASAPWVEVVVERFSSHEDAFGATEPDVRAG
jgi:hypothetical protein